MLRPQPKLGLGWSSFDSLLQHLYSSFNSRRFWVRLYHNLLILLIWVLALTSKFSDHSYLRYFTVKLFQVNQFNPYLSGLGLRRRGETGPAKADIIHLPVSSAIR